MSTNPCCGHACRYWQHLTDSIGMCEWTTEAAPEWIKGGAVSREGDYAGCMAFELRERDADLPSLDDVRGILRDVGATDGQG